jgi:hypothetical protein
MPVVTGEGVRDCVSSLSGDGDSHGHFVGQGSLAEDGKAEEVDLGLSDGPSHVCTSRRILGLDRRLWTE